MGQGVSWLNIENEILIKYYGKVKSKELAMFLGKSEAALRNQANKIRPTLALQTLDDHLIINFVELKRKEIIDKLDAKYFLKLKNEVEHEQKSKIK